MIAAILSVSATLWLLDRWLHTQSARRLAPAPVPVTRT